MKAKKISHVAIRVKEKKKAVQLFSELFGMEFTELPPNKETDTSGALSSIGVEIIEPLTPGGPTAKSIERFGQGLALLSFEVSGLEEALTEIKSRGIRVVANVDRPDFRAAVLHPADVFGTMIELIEHKTK